MSSSYIMVLGRGHLVQGLLSQVCLCVASDQWSSQASSLLGHHDTGLVVVSGSLPARPAQVAPFEGHMSGAYSHPGPMITGEVLLVPGLLPILETHVGLPRGSSQARFFQGLLGY